MPAVVNLAPFGPENLAELVQACNYRTSATVLARLARSRCPFTQAAVAQHTGTPRATLMWIAEHGTDRARKALLARDDIDVDVGLPLVSDRYAAIRAGAALSPWLPEWCQEQMATDWCVQVRIALATRADLTLETRTMLLNDRHWWVRKRILRSPATPRHVWRRASRKHRDPNTRAAAIGRKDMTLPTLATLMKDPSVLALKASESKIANQLRRLWQCTSMRPSRKRPVLQAFLFSPSPLIRQVAVAMAASL